MWASHTRTRIVPVLLGAALLALAASGCVHHSGTYYTDGYRATLVHKAPAHGHRYHRDGAVLVFATALDSYVVEGYVHHYFHRDRYYRYHNGRWWTGPRLRGRWVPVELSALPYGLRRHRVDTLHHYYWRPEAKDRRDDRRKEAKARSETAKDRREKQQKEAKARRETAKDRREKQQKEAKARREHERKIAERSRDQRREVAKDRRDKQREEAKDRREDRREATKARRDDRRQIATERRDDRREASRKAAKNRRQDAEDRGEERRDSSKFAAWRMKGK